MVRTQVQLTEEQVRRLRRLAHRRGASMAALVRQAVDNLLQSTDDTRAERYARAESLVGSFEDREAATDVAEHHDDYLDEAFT